MVLCLHHLEKKCLDRLSNVVLYNVVLVTHNRYDSHTMRLKMALG